VASLRAPHSQYVPSELHGTDTAERLARLEGSLQAAGWVLGIVALVLVAMFGFQTYISFNLRKSAMREMERVHRIVDRGETELQEKKTAAGNVLRECQETKSAVEASAADITNRVFEIVYKTLSSWPELESTYAAPDAGAQREVSRDVVMSPDKAAIRELSERLADSSLYAALMGARSYLQSGDAQAAVSLLQKAESPGRDSSEYHFLLAKALIETGDSLKARGELAQAEKLKHPDRAAILKLHFQSYVKEKDYTNAERIADTGRREFPKDLGFVTNKGECLTRTGRDDDAVKFSDEVVSDEFLSRHGNMWREAGRALLDSGRDDVVSLGIQRLEKAKIMNAGDNLPYVVLGNFYFTRGDFDKALGEYRGALARAGEATRSDIKALFETKIGRTLARKGSLDEARKQFHHAIGLYYHPESALGLCEVLLALNEVTTARGELQRLDASRFSDSLAWYHLLRTMAYKSNEDSQWRESSKWLRENLNRKLRSNLEKLILTDGARRALSEISAA